MANQGSLISVIICAYNAGAFIKDAMASILAQTYQNFEILVVDDGSTDGSVDAARSFFSDPRIRWFRQVNLGKPTAMNMALDNVRGDFYVIQDADDMSDSRRLECQLKAMLDNPSVAGVFTGHELILHGRHLAPLTRPKSIAECRSDIERMAMPGHDPTAMYRMEYVRNFRYDARLHIGEGYDYILRIGERYPLLVLGESLYSYRVHFTSLTHRDPDRREALVREVIRSTCERRGIDFDTWCATRISKLNSRAARADNGVAAHFISSVQDQKSSGKILSALGTGFRCIRLCPLDPHYYKALVYAVTPVQFHTYLKSSK